MSNKTYVKASAIKFDKASQDYRGKKCMVPISVGQPAHEGKKLEASIELINKYFSECIILVCDTLQRHALAILEPNIDKSGNDLLVLSKDEGDKWLHRNIKYIERLNVPYRVLRWDEWLEHKDFYGYQEYVENLYQNNSTYKLAIENTVDEYIKRLAKRDQDIDEDRARSASRMYLKEECAAMSLLVIDQCYNIILYPTHIIPVAETLKLLRLDDKCSHPFSMLGIRFKKSQLQDTDQKYSLENIINNIPGHVYWKDKAGRFLGCNLKQAISYGAKNLSEIINRTDSDLIGRKLGDVIRKNDLNIMETGNVQLIEEEVLIKGKQRTVISHKSPFLDNHGRILGVVGVSINISKPKDKEI